MARLGRSFREARYKVTVHLFNKQINTTTADTQLKRTQNMVFEQFCQQTDIAKFHVGKL